jgi:multidrug efflux pump subunit AcrA (membrane-fusion protein)
MKKVLFRVIAVAVVAALGWGGYRLVKSLPSRQRDVATTRVRRGDVTVRTYSRGELQAVRQMTLTAPNLFGTVQVTRLAPLGAFAREGDLIVEFDDAEVLSRLEEKQLELDQIGERIRKSEADLAIRNNQDEVELLRARYTVRRAELEVQRNELLSQISRKRGGGWKSSRATSSRGGHRRKLSWRCCAKTAARRSWRCSGSASGCAT